MITTAEHTRWPSDHPIRDLRPTGLQVACAVRWEMYHPGQPSVSPADRPSGRTRCGARLSSCARASSMAVAERLRAAPRCTSLPFWVAAYPLHRICSLVVVRGGVSRHGGRPLGSTSIAPGSPCSARSCCTAAAPSAWCWCSSFSDAHVLFGLMILGPVRRVRLLRLASLPYRHHGRAAGGAARDHGRDCGSLAVVLANDVVVFAMTPMLCAGLLLALPLPRLFVIALAGGADAGRRHHDPEQSLTSHRRGRRPEFWLFLAACALAVARLARRVPAGRLAVANALMAAAWRRRPLVVARARPALGCAGRVRHLARPAGALRDAAAPAHRACCWWRAIS